MVILLEIVILPRLSGEVASGDASCAVKSINRASIAFESRRRKLKKLALYYQALEFFPAVGKGAAHNQNPIASPGLMLSLFFGRG
jgi:hypothetical protein